MTFEQKTVRFLYKKLVALYPRTFREQLGESMEQTFNDLCRERIQTVGQATSGFVLWMFIETAIGVIKENLILVKRGAAMENTITKYKSAAIIGFLLVLPFMILDLWFQIVKKPTAFGLENIIDFIMLFGFLWLLPSAFIVILAPIARRARAGNDIMTSPINLLLKIAFLVFIAWMWGGLMIDQFPCFIGVPNCD